MLSFQFDHGIQTLLAGVPGLSFRHWESDPDYQRLASVMNSSMQAVGTGHTVSAEELFNLFERGGNFSPTEDGFAAEVDGELVGWARPRVHYEADGSVIIRHEPQVQADWHGRGIGRALMQLVENRAATILHDDLRPRGILQLNLSEGAHVWREYAEGHGYEPTRYFFEMARDLGLKIPELALPEGFDVRPVKPEHVRPIWRALDEAFSDHWGHHVATEARYQAFAQDPLQDPALWKVAWAGDEIAGAVLNVVDESENVLLGRKRGYTEDIGVRRPYRRRGLATSLLARSLRMLKELGYEEAALTVDSENENSALKLYASLGFKKVRTTIVYRKPLAHPAGG